LAGGIEKMDHVSPIPLDAIMLYRRGTEYSSKKNHEAALKYLNGAVIVAPKFATALCEMGCCYEELGRFPEALLKFDNVLRIDPSNVEAERNKNRIMEKMGKK
jgi:tetratricopeptide (TPR) repeat protein